jgi:hypothetical protein
VLPSLSSLRRSARSHTRWFKINKSKHSTLAVASLDDTAHLEFLRRLGARKIENKQRHSPRSNLSSGYPFPNFTSLAQREQNHQELLEKSQRRVRQANAKREMFEGASGATDITNGITHYCTEGNN